MKKLAVLTGTRADFGLLAPIIKKLRTFPDLDVRLAVSTSFAGIRPDGFGN